MFHILARLGTTRRVTTHLHRTLCDLGYHLPLDRQQMPSLDIHAVLAVHASHEQHSCEGLELNPRTCASARAHHCGRSRPKGVTISFIHSFIHPHVTLRHLPGPLRWLQMSPKRILDLGTR